jgi:glycosyltransferase involved in cell wall biosynthesis
MVIETIGAGVNTCPFFKEAYHCSEVYGVPLVTTRVGGVPEAAGSHSLYAKHSSPDDLAEKIALVLDNQVDRQAMIDTGIEHVKKFNCYTITNAFVQYLEECNP